MIKDVFDAIGAAARKLFTNWGALLISFALYSALIAALYLFFTTREATYFQVVLTVVFLPLAAIVIFFTLQAMGLSYVRIGVGPLYLLRRALKESWMLLLVSLPLILVGWLAVYLFGYAETKLVAEAENPGRWIGIALSWGLIVILYFVLPLIAIHCWISAEREGLASAFKGIFRNIGRAFGPRSVMIYVLIILVFGALAYFLFFTKTQMQDEWMELWMLGARLVAALVTTFFGWFLTLGALAEMTSRRALSEMEM
jgi:hypothetical protein